MPKDRFFVLDEGASRHTRVPLPASTTVKAGAEDTEGRFSLLETRGNAVVPAHVDDTADGFVYVVDGDLEVEAGGETHHLTSGTCALLPRGVEHAIRGLGGEGSRAHTLYLSAPGGLEHHLEDLAEANADVPPGGTLDMQAVAEAGKPYGVRYRLGEAALDQWGDKDRLLLLGKGEVRPGRIPLPPAFAVKARTADTDGLFSLLEVTVAQPVPRHTHHVADECIYVLGGELLIDFDGETRTLGPGQFVLLPHGVPHAIRPGSVPPRVIQISSPGGWECVVEALIEHRTEVSRSGRFDPAALNRYTRRYHVVYDED